MWRWDGDGSAGSLCDTETKALSCFERDFPLLEKTAAERLSSFG